MSRSIFREVECETCGALIGEMCGRQRRGASAQWERVPYHAARKRRISEMAEGASAVIAFALHKLNPPERTES